MVDVDKFKRINDNYGHDRGDEVLVECATRIKRSVGLKGKTYRWGGEEIVAILPNFSVSEAAAVAERIRADVHSLPMTGENLEISVSVGVATLPDHAEDEVSLFRAADKAMYSAKQGGRNKVGVAPPIQVESEPENQAN